MNFIINNRIYLGWVFFIFLTILLLIPIHNGQNFALSIIFFLQGNAYNPVALMAFSVWVLLLIGLLVTALNGWKHKQGPVKADPFYNISAIRPDILKPINAKEQNRGSQMIIEELIIPEEPTSSPPSTDAGLTKKYRDKGENKQVIEPSPSTDRAKSAKSDTTRRKKKLATVDTGIKVEGTSFIQQPGKKELLLDRLKKQKLLTENK